MRRHVTTILLIVVAIVLGVWLWRDRENVTDSEKKRREHSVFSAWRKDEVSRIEIAHDDETIVLERDAKADSSWRLTSPRSERADHGAVERLLTALEFAQISRNATTDGQLGLDAPRASGSVTMGKLVFRFALGGTSPRPEGSGYFSVDGAPPIVVSRELVTNLLARSDTYRDRTVVPYLSLEMARFEVERPGGGFAVERLDEHSFKVLGPNVLAARDALDKVWAALAEMRAEAFPKDADADRLTASPKLKIRIVPKEAKSEGEILIGDACPGHPDDVVVLRTKPTRVAACAPKGALEALYSTPASLVERRPLSLKADEIEEVRFESTTPRPDAGAPSAPNAPNASDAGAPPHAIELARKGSGFHQREPIDKDLTAEEADAVSELLVTLEHALADDVHAISGTPAFHPIAKARVRAGAREEAIEVGPFDGPTVRARRVRDGAELTLARSVARLLVPRATTTKPRVILGDTHRVKKVILRCGTPQELVDTGTGLKLQEPKGFDTDASVSQLVDALTRGKSDLWVADEPDGTMGLESADGCRVVLVFEGGNDTTIRFGNESEGAVYGKESQSPHVFLGSLAIRDLAKRIYVSRAALRVPADKLTDVRIAPKPSAALPPLERRREAAANLYADEVEKVGTNDLPSVDLTIELVLAEGPPKRVRCGAVEKKQRRCVTDGTKAIFRVSADRVDALLVEAAHDK